MTAVRVKNLLETEEQVKLFEEFYEALDFVNALGASADDSPVSGRINDVVYEIIDDITEEDMEW